MKDIRLHEVGGSERETIADIVFVHGVGGDHDSTWRRDGPKGTYWPAWIAEDLPWARVWALDYPADAMWWQEDASAMGVIDRARNILDYLSASGIGERMTLFVGYSMGGVLVKQLLHTSQSMMLPKWAGVLKNTRGVVFLATPHVGSALSPLATALSAVVKPTPQIRDLASGSPLLRQLSDWFRENVTHLNLRVEAYFETVPLPGGVLVVDATSGNPNVAGCVPVGIDANHFSICKPRSRDELIYKGVRRFLESFNQRKEIYAYFVPGYNDEFRRLKDALNHDDAWRSVTIVEEDAFRLFHQLEHNPLRDGILHVFFLDLSASHEQRNEISYVLDLVRRARGQSRGLSQKPIFVHYGYPHYLEHLLEAGALRPTEHEQLARYFTLRQDQDLRIALPELQKRIRDEWTVHPCSSPSPL